MYLLTRDASVQFRQPLVVRVVRELTDRQTYHGWTWLDCYVLNRNGEAIAKRQLFVMPKGLRRTRVRPAAPTERGRGSTRAGRAAQ